MFGSKGPSMRGFGAKVTVDEETFGIDSEIGCVTAEECATGSQAKALMEKSLKASLKQ